MHLRVVFREAFLPELNQPVTLDEVIVFLVVVFPDNWTVVKDIFLSLLKSPFRSPDNILRLSPAGFTRPVAVELESFVGNAIYLVHDRLKTLVGCEEIRVLHHLDQTVVVVLQHSLLVGHFEH